ncbi:MAG: FliH/SctL family protein [Candidatus Kapaibacterium sp.]|jgi:flagellar assembly protein FliH
MVFSERNRRKIARARIVSVDTASSIPNHIFEEFERTIHGYEHGYEQGFDGQAGHADGAQAQAEAQEPAEITILAEQLEVDIQAAYDRGFTDGQSVTSALMESELSSFREKVSNIDTVIHELREQFAMETEQMHTIAVNVALAIAEHILHREVSANSHVAVEQAKKVLSTMHGTREVIIRVHPDSYETMKEANSQLLNATSTLRKVDILSDESVERGGCILESSMGTVDTQFRHQLDHLRTTMEETVRVKELAGEF